MANVARIYAVWCTCHSHSDKAPNLAMMETLCLLSETTDLHVSTWPAHTRAPLVAAITLYTTQSTDSATDMTLQMVQ